ncbi:MAG: HEAT repeat domain-containing protein [Nitrospirales bacterium]|nr:HEAT repeat domain-containing protein [Nitrospira sp.]MDR4500725.1 HEAT repeat domain-containing protein [Nitrospirales bacterium]
MPQTVEEWLEALEDIDDATREEAATALSKLGDPSTIDSILSAIEDDYWAVRAKLGWALAKIGGPKAIDGLVTLFNDSMMEVQSEAVQAMSSMGQSVAPRMITCLKDTRWKVREQAAKVLGEIKDPQAVQALSIACRDRDGAVKSAAAEALGKIGDSKGIPTLIKLFKDTSKIVRETAGTALVYIGPASVDALLETLKDPHFVVRCHGVRALGGMTTDYQIGRAWVKEPRVVEALIALLKDPDRAVREDATIALGNIGDPAAVDALIETMKDGAVKRHAIASLGMIGDPRALPAVLDALKGKGIHQEGTPTPGCIISEEQLVKEAAATALGHFRHPRVIPDLILLLKDIVLRDYAAASLVLVGDNAVEPLVSFLHDPEISKVGKESERVLAFATTRLTASSALKKVVRETLEKLGWEPALEEKDPTKDIEYTDTSNVLGLEGRFGTSGDFAKPAKELKIER